MDQSKGFMNVGFVSACKAEQTAADALIDGEFCGVMLYNFERVSDAHADSSLSLVTTLTGQALQAANFAQEPQCDGFRVGNRFLA